MNPLAFVEREIQQLKDDGVFRAERILTSPQGGRAVIDGKDVVNLSSNDYLGLAADPRMREAAAKAADTYGAGTAAVRTIIGTMELHRELERALAAFKHVEAVTVFQSGFTCNSGVIPVVMGEGDVIISDELNHASIIDGCRLSKAKTVRFRHKDMVDLKARLEETQGARHRMIVTDGVFSMDGDIAPLPSIVSLAQTYGAITYVDDAHASGVLGSHGRGTVNHYGLDGQVDIQVGTLSKAIGVLGGYVATTQALVDFLRHRGRPYLFSTSHPPAVTAACLQAVRILEQDDALVKRLWENARYFKKGLTDLGFDTGNSETPITPVMAGEGRKAMELSDRLFDRGVFAQGIAFPTVPRGKARVRTIVTAGHTKEDLDEALSVFAEAGKELGLIG